MTDQIKLTLGYSPCPNDTYIFYGLVHGKVPVKHFSLATPVLDDVETLNRWALDQKLDISKLSFHALGHVLDSYSLLRTGAALGRGCGPMLITGKNPKPPKLKDWKVAIPGEYTTAAMLLRLYDPQCISVEVMRFEKIPDAVAQGTVDGGVIIHESRFTYKEKGLECVQDLGAWWEEATGLPIPLGCIAAHRSLSMDTVREIESAIRESLAWAINNPTACEHYISRYAQELEADVINSHIGLYVNDFSLDLGEEGVAAVMELIERGSKAGLFTQSEINRGDLFR